ncbi:MAG TPA: hypothetical protein VGD41_02565 [Pyrinomonadaceae bacterium]
MNRNQKIALGCGGAGCLGLIVVAIAGCLIYFFAYRSPRSTRDYNFNVSTNRNSNSNDNSDFSANANNNANTNDNDNSSNSNTNSSSTSVSSLSDDDKHKLYQAAIQTGDQELIRRVSVKIGVMDEDFTPGSNYQEFVSEHVGWVIRNTDFLGTINSPEKARAYVNEHFPQ